jgi:hypothetical protein
VQYSLTLYPHEVPDIDFSLVSKEEMINKLKSRNSSGYDGITNELIKLSSQQISIPLTYIINTSLIVGVILKD